MASGQEQLRRELDHRSAVQNHWTQRFEAQAAFAEGLMALESRHADEWRQLLAEARGIVREAAVSEQQSLEKAVRRAEQVLAPIGKVAKTYTIHCVGHAHIDMNWMWSWPETVAITNDTFTTVLKLMEEFPGFCFTQSQASVYEIVRRYNPQLLEQIRQRVTEGRWEVAASQWVEGDKNLASGESLARHLLYTRRFMKEHLGLEPQDVPIDWEPDTFGHAHTIPSILVRGGVRFYYMCRGGSFAKPPIFWWRGPDGSKVLVNLEQTWYINAIAPELALKAQSFWGKTGLKDCMLVYGVGDHGGGPTRRDLRRAIDMDGWPIYPNWKFATTRRYYQILEAQGDKLPTLDRELNYEFPGCYTSQSVIKRNNRHGENMMTEADTAAALAYAAAGCAYPHEALREAWQNVLFSHFHDILPGSGVADTRQFNQGMFQQISATAGMVKTQSLRALAHKIDTAFAGEPAAAPVLPEAESIALGGGVGRSSHDGLISSAAHVKDGPRAVVVFNPTAWPRQETVTATLWDAGTGSSPGDLHAKQFVVRLSDGSTLPAQKLATGNYWGHDYLDLAFPVTVGPLAYTACVIEEGQAAASVPRVRKIEDKDGGWSINLPAGRLAIENEFLQVQFDKRTGGIVHLIDRKTGQDLASPQEPMGLLEYVLERPIGMSAWVLGDEQQRICPLHVTSLQATQEGDYQASVTAQVRLNDSRLSVTYTLKAGQPSVELTVSGRWLERGGPDIGTPRLSMRFPTALASAKPRYEIPFGSIQRDEAPGREVPSLRWAEISGVLADGKTAASCAILNDCKYGHSLDGSTMRVTLIRSSYDPDPLPELGDHSVRLAIAPHVGQTPVADLVRLGAAFNHPLQVVNTDIHRGDLPAELRSAVSCDCAHVIVSQIKKAEDADVLIVRLYETAGMPADVRVTLDAKFLGAVQSVTEVDLLERPVTASSAQVAGNGFAIRLAPHGISTVAVRLKR